MALKRHLRNPLIGYFISASELWAVGEMQIMAQKGNDISHAIIKYISLSAHFKPKKHLSN
jgi:hypothetical protein